MKNLSSLKVSIFLAALVLALTVYVLFVVQREKALEEGVVAFKQENYTEAVAILMPLAQKGNQTAELILGIAYAHGYGVPRDRKRAQELIIASNEKEAAEHFYSIAERFEKGEQTTKDLSEAAAWYELAAERGHNRARQILDEMKKRRK